MKKLLIFISVLALLLSSTVVMGYVINKIETNTVKVEIGEKEDVKATLEILEKNKVLIPYQATKTRNNEVKELTLKLNVVSSKEISFRVVSELGDEFELRNFQLDQIHNSNGNYTIEFKLRLVKEVKYNIKDIKLEIVLVEK